jgi:hypothetical protein
MPTRWPRWCSEPPRAGEARAAHLSFLGAQAAPRTERGPPSSAPRLPRKGVLLEKLSRRLRLFVNGPPPAQGQVPRLVPRGELPCPIPCLPHVQPANLSPAASPPSKPTRTSLRRSWTSRSRSRRRWERSIRSSARKGPRSRLTPRTRSVRFVGRSRSFKRSPPPFRRSPTRSRRSPPHSGSFTSFRRWRRPHRRPHRPWRPHRRPHRPRHPLLPRAPRSHVQARLRSRPP